MGDRLQRAPDRWGEVFGDDVVDRLTFGGYIIETGTDSYRLAKTCQNRE